ncbi:MAG: hypothetical protein COB15_05800 [Flavobacteriales bacterium]|nr:MAG: hypothetical protein COB15_05800 [Flavobacteriales bacterium]
MKNLIIATIIIFFSCTSIFSQKVSIGPEIGVNIIPIENSGIGQNYQLGYHFGGHIKYHFSKKYKLSTGLFITQKKKGYSSSTTSSVLTLLDNFLEFSGGFGGAPDTTDLDSLINIPGLNMDMTEDIKGVSSEIFIEIPLLANYKYKNVNFYLGPYVGILISATRKEELTTDIPVLDVIDMEDLGLDGLTSFFLPSSGTEVSSISGTDGLRTIDFGLNAGIGYEMNNLHFNLMYSHGLLDYRADNEGEPLETLKLFRISIAYLFDLKKKEKTGSAKFD